MTDSDVETKPDGTEAPSAPGSFIVGVGASAGGLEAIRELVKNLPDNVAATYVIVQHMSPRHKSLLTKLIGRETELNVIEIESGTVPEANTVYVTPPNHDIVLRNGILQLQTPSTAAAAPSPSVDRFFISVAEDAGERAVGIVLSGTGTDGAYGIQAIRAAGGISIAQDDKSAKYDGMPVAAVETGCVDLVMKPEDIGQHLSKILSQPRSFEELRPSGTPEYPVSDLLQILFARTRVDFREYKPSTVQRRIERRMAALGIEDQKEYTSVCRSNPREVDALFKDLLISVTRFFRDPESFEALRSYIDKLVADRQGRTLRIWVAGCATGEEAYSIAIMVAEALGGVEKLGKDVMQIFASDIDTNALKIARAARYSLAALDDVPEELISRYFVRYDDGIEVMPSIKQLVLFSDHNVCQDPPFRNVDLVCCRNLLIYFDNALQRKVLTRLNYALNQGGILFLGAAETIGGSESLFKPLSERMHIYGKRLVTRSFGRAQADSLVNAPGRWANPPDARDGAELPKKSSDRPMFDALARSLGKNTLLVSRDLLILKVYGDISPFVTLTETSRLQLSANMLRPPLANEARTLVTLSLKNGTRRRGTLHQLEGSDRVVQLEALPVMSSDLDESCALLVFHEANQETQRRPAREEARDSAEANDHIALLERELDSTREALNQTIEELETSNEELQSLNEELQSTNEELQSLNEELETSNEELQSTNEELVTVNEELQVGAAETAVMAEELDSILSNVATPIIVVDNALQVTRFSIAAAEMFALTSRAEAPHISQCAHPRGFPPLADIFAEALRLGRTETREVVTEQYAYTLHCSPFSDHHGKLGGATLFIVENGPARLVQELQEVIDRSPLMLIKRDANGRILRISQGAISLLGLKSQDDALGKIMWDLHTPEDAAAFREQDREFLRSDRSVSINIRRATNPETGEQRWLRYERFRAPDTDDGHPALYVVATDISDLREIQNELGLMVRQRRLVQDMAGIAFWTIDIATGEHEWSDQVFDLFGVSRADQSASRDVLLTRIHPEDRELVRDAFRDAVEHAKPLDFSARVVRPDGSEATVRSVSRQTMDEAGRLTHIVGVFWEEDENGRPISRFGD